MSHNSLRTLRLHKSDLWVANCVRRLVRMLIFSVFDIAILEDHSVLGFEVSLTTDYTDVHGFSFASQIICAIRVICGSLILSHRTYDACPQ